jgi:hypothetical protein
MSTLEKQVPQMMLEDLPISKEAGAGRRFWVFDF